MGQFPLCPCTLYLNPCSTKEEVRQFALETIADDLHKLEAAGKLLQHAPRKPSGTGAELGIELIAACLNRVLL